MRRSAGRQWTPGPIGPEPSPRSVAVSVRMPSELYEELGQYARRVGAPRSYLINECVRRLLAADGIRAPRKARRSRSKT